MAHAIWLTEGLSSQRDLIRNIRLFAQTLQVDLTIFASHRQPRHEILSEADFSLTEPADENERLAFILSVTEKYGIQVIHAGRNIPWFETHRNTITASGTRLITGVASLSDYAVADDKVRFAAEMASHGLPVVPSVQITSAAQLRDALSHSPFPDCRCALNRFRAFTVPVSGSLMTMRRRWPCSQTLNGGSPHRSSICPPLKALTNAQRRY